MWTLTVISHNGVNTVLDFGFWQGFKLTYFDLSISGADKRPDKSVRSGARKTKVDNAGSSITCTVYTCVPVIAWCVCNTLNVYVTAKV